MASHCVVAAPDRDGDAAYLIVVADRVLLLDGVLLFWNCPTVRAYRGVLPVDDGDAKLAADHVIAYAMSMCLPC